MDPCLLIVYWRRKVVKIINKSNEVFSDKTLGFNYFRFTSICSTCHISFRDVAVTMSSSWDVHVEEVSNLSGRQRFAKDSPTLLLQMILQLVLLLSKRSLEDSSKGNLSYGTDHGCPKTSKMCNCFRLQASFSSSVNIYANEVC